MKRMFLLLSVLMILFLVPVRAEKMDTTGLEQQALADFPGWQINRSTSYGSGRWQEEMALYHEIRLVKTENNTLYFKELSVLSNPLQKGDPVPWQETDYAPIPLTEEAAANIYSLLSLKAAREITDYGNGAVIKEQYYPGCAAFLLNDGERITNLISYPGQLVAVVENAAGQEALRIAEWDGNTYAKVTCSPFQLERIYINIIHSATDYLEMSSHTWELVMAHSKENQWKMEYLNDGYDVFLLHDEYIENISNEHFFTANHNYHYGTLPGGLLLENMNVSSLPADGDALVEGLCTDHFACVKAEGTPMLDAPEGNVLACMHPRATGKIVSEKGDWVQLLFGSEEKGMQGWFCKSNLAFGKEIETVECAFPSYDREIWYDLEDFSTLLPGVEFENNPSSTDVWLIGKAPDGRWLTQTAMDTVTFAPESSFTGIGPTEQYEEYWSEDWEEYWAETDDVE